MKRFTELAQRELATLYPALEVNAIVTRLLESVTGYSRSQLLADKNSELSPENEQTLLAKLQQLANGEPLQYVLGETEFYGLRFKVDSSVLIPRPETEELVYLILSENGASGLSVLDIGTGSGCIAISLAKLLKSPCVEAWDISEKALSLARENARLNEVELHFKQMDILDEAVSGFPLDVVVSNPPYVCLSEKSAMHTNVIDFEPHLALFVDDNDPLIFYRKITQFSSHWLKNRGKLYFEINAAFGSQVAQLLQNSNFTEVEIIKDIFGKDRIVKGCKA